MCKPLPRPAPQTAVWHIEREGPATAAPPLSLEGAPGGGGGGRRHWRNKLCWSLFVDGELKLWNLWVFVTRRNPQLPPRGPCVYAVVRPSLTLLRLRDSQPTKGRADNSRGLKQSSLAGAAAAQQNRFSDGRLNRCWQSQFRSSPPKRWMECFMIIERDRATVQWRIAVWWALRWCACVWITSEISITHGSRRCHLWRTIQAY